MVTIKLLDLNSAATAITVSVETDQIGHTITKALIWDKNTYNDPTTAIDLTSLLDGTNQTEDFIVSNTVLGVDNIKGLYIMEFTSSEETDNIQTGVVANLVPYHECILDKALQTDIKNCSIQKPNCKESDNLLFTSTLLDTLYDTILFDLIEESIQIIETLDDLCEVCVNCPDYNVTLAKNGYGYKTIDNLTILT
jgi:hypothetical protein